MSTTLTATSTKLLGLVAGEGKLPELLAKSAKDKGYTVIALALSPEAEARVAPHCSKVHLIAPGQMSRNFSILKKEGIKDLVFIGKVPKLNLLHNLHKLDWMAVKELSKMPNFNDDTIQRFVGDMFEANGLRVLSQSEFMRHLFPNVGVKTKRQPTAVEYADVEFGFKVAKEIARLDIGQTVIVKDQMILAVEAIEGTDQAIRRAVALAKGPVVVVKVAKPNRDERFDTPTAGMSTLEAMLGQGDGGVMAVAANETMFVDEKEMIAFCEEHDIALLAV